MATTTTGFPGAEVPDSRGPTVLPMCLAATVLCIATAAAIFIPGADFVAAMQGVSGKLRDSELDVTLLATGVLAMLALVCVMAALFVKQHTFFLVVLILSFSFSEILIPGANYASLALRYACMFVLVACAAVQLTSAARGPGLVPTLGLALLVWMICSCFFGGANPAAFTLLPIYFAMLLGALFGMQERYRAAEQISKLNSALVLAGVVLTIIHVSSFWLSPDPYESGRFKSFYVLPTNFSNSYVLVVVAMLWYTMNARAVLRRAVTGVCALVGIALIAISGTRNALAVAALCAISLALASRARVFYLVLFGAAFMVGLGVDFMGGGQTLSELAGRFSDFSLANRADVWTLAWREIDASPVVGHGLGVTTTLLNSQVEVWQRATFINAHNAYLGIWLQLGLVGLTGIIAIYGLTLWRGGVLLLKLPSGNPLLESLSLPAVLVLGLAAAGIAEENLSGRGSLQQIVWALSIAAVNGAYRAFRAHKMAGSPQTLPRQVMPDRSLA